MKRRHRRSESGLGYWGTGRTPTDPHSRPEASLAHLRTSTASIIKTLSAWMTEKGLKELAATKRATS